MRNITKMDINDLRKTLGLMTCPSGSMQQQQKQILGKFKEWITKVKNGIYRGDRCGCLSGANCGQQYGGVLELFNSPRKSSES